MTASEFASFAHAAKSVKWPLAAIASLAAGPAFAHAGDALTGGFVSGFLHPLTGPDHLLAMVAVGLWGAFLGRPLVYLLPVIFPTVMAVGGVLAMAGAPAPPIELGIALSVVLLGAAIAAAFRAPVWLAAVLVGLFGLFHGYAHGLELPTAADPVGYSAGFVLATGLLHIIGIGLGLLKNIRRGVAAIRLIGVLIAISGVYFLSRVVMT